MFYIAHYAVAPATIYRWDREYQRYDEYPEEQIDPDYNEPEERIIEEPYDEEYVEEDYVRTEDPIYEEPIDEYIEEEPPLEEEIILDEKIAP